MLKYEIEIAQLKARCDGLFAELKTKEAQLAAKDAEIAALNKEAYLSNLRELASKSLKELNQLRQDILVKGGTQHAPTQWAYDAVCAALESNKKELKKSLEKINEASEIIKKLTYEFGGTHSDGCPAADIDINDNDPLCNCRAGLIIWLARAWQKENTND